jgi:hypothetical protein
VLSLKLAIYVQKVNDGQAIVLLKFQCAQFVLAGNDPDDLQTFGLVVGCELANLASFLLAAPSPAGPELQKDRDPSVVCRTDFSAKNVGQFKLDGLRTAQFRGFLGGSKPPDKPAASGGNAEQNNTSRRLCRFHDVPLSFSSVS